MGDKKNIEGGALNDYAPDSASVLVPVLFLHCSQENSLFSDVIITMLK